LKIGISILGILERRNFVWSKKCKVKFLLIAKKNYNEYNPITKEGRIFESPLYLKLDSSCDDRE